MITRKHDRDVLLLSLATSVPGLALGLGLLWTGEHAVKVKLTVTVLALGAWAGFTIALCARVVRPLQTLANLLAAIREGDYSLRARTATKDDSLGLALGEVNALGDALRRQRFREIEALLLLDRVLGETRSGIFVVDADGILRLINRAGQEILGVRREQAIGRRARDLGLGACLVGDTRRVLRIEFHGTARRWDVRRSSVRGDGAPQTLIVLTNVESALRLEERNAWQRLIRVLSHEINNSLAPIQSIASTLLQTLQREPAEPRHGDMHQGLEIIQRRAEGLGRFLHAYARLARLPQPTLRAFAVRPWLQRIAELETRLPVSLEASPEVELRADPDQLDQVLINLVRNAVDAALETGGDVALGWRSDADHVEIWVEDNGPGLPETANLFVPFFTTKAGGSGIGLALSRAIIEGHGGSLHLANREHGQGCRAVVSLPRAV